MSEIGVLDVIGAIGNVISIIQFAQSAFPGGGSSPASIASYAGPSLLRIHSGDVENAGGRIAALNLYSEKQEQLNHTKWHRYNEKEGNVGQATFTDFSLDSQGKQPTYVQIINSEDAICIAYIAQTWPDGQKRGWTGDMGRVCGQSWAWSDITVSPGPNAPPLACTWLDWNHDNIRSAGMQIHMQDFANTTADYSKEVAYYCNTPAQVFQQNIDHGTDAGFWLHSDDATPAVPVQSRRRRRHQESEIVGSNGRKKRSATLARRIVGSYHAQQSALELCESETSYGADFVSFHEGVFCDMDEKKAWPLCSTVNASDCYHWDTHTLITRGGQQARQYDKVSLWGRS